MGKLSFGTFLVHWDWLLALFFIDVVLKIYLLMAITMMFFICNDISITIK